VAEIAREKAGIFKAGAAAVIGEPDPEIAAQLAAHARRAGAERVLSLLERGLPTDVALGADGTSFTLAWDGVARRFTTPLVGRHQALNAATALLTLEALGEPWGLDDRATAAALATVRVPGRFDRRPPWLFDVAHNPDGAAVLARTVAAVDVERPIATVLAVLADKDWRAMMAALAPVTDVFVLTTAPTAPSGRVWDPHEALAFAEARGWPAVLVPEFDESLAEARARGRTVLVTGSFHTVGDALARLQVGSSAG
jgi:dihydrofolate synthase/folylpolyglutamate synthase